MVCAGSGYGVDFRGMAPCVDKFNLMTYDMGIPTAYHSALYDSERVGWLSCGDRVRTLGRTVAEAME